MSPGMSGKGLSTSNLPRRVEKKKIYLFIEKILCDTYVNFNIKKINL